jgi:hypothetical protein
MAMIGPIVAATAVAAAAQRAMAEAMAKTDRSWVPYAHQRGLSYRPGRQGWARVEMPRLDGVVDDVRVAVELWRDTGEVETMAMAVAEAPLQGHLEVRREGLSAKLSKLFGAQDVVLGDEAFDAAFLVKAAPPQLAPQLLVPGLRAELLAFPTTYLAYDDGSEHSHPAMVAFAAGLVVEEPDVLDRMVRVVTSLARVRSATSAYR